MYRFYSKPIANTGRTTIVATFVDGVVNVAAARCSTKDNFIRKKGRQIAEGRLVKGKLIHSFKIESFSSADFIALANNLITQVEETKVVFNA